MTHCRLTSFRPTETVGRPAGSTDRPDPDLLSISHIRLNFWRGRNLQEPCRRRKRRLRQRRQRWRRAHTCDGWRSKESAWRRSARISRIFPPTLSQFAGASLLPPRCSSACQPSGFGGRHRAKTGTSSGGAPDSPTRQRRHPAHRLRAAAAHGDHRRAAHSGLGTEIHLCGAGCLIYFLFYLFFWSASPLSLSPWMFFWVGFQAVFS